MLFHDILERFIQRSPFTVMIRGLLENLLRPDKLDALFDRTADQQYTRTLLFSSVVELMALVVCKIRPSLRAAFQSRQAQVGVSVTAVYDKVNHVEPAITAAMVRQVATDATAVIDTLAGGRLPDWLPGYATRIVDGNHLAGTEHRLKELRQTNQAALPGLSLVVLDAERGLALQVVPCEDAHAQERSLLAAVRDTIRAKDLWLTDRNFCVGDWLFSLAAQSACFVARYHRGSFACAAVGPERPAGRVETGQVFEQTVRVQRGADTLFLRRVRLALDQPTQDGEWEIVLLTNLPAADADAGRVAELYRRRWTIEGLFQDLTVALRCELDTLGYPRAALFGFGTALVAYNALAVAKAALRSVQGAARVEEVSEYQLVEEVSAVHEGLDIAVADWSAFQGLTPRALGAVLRELASYVKLPRFAKHRRGPKKPRPKRKSGDGNTHVATARLLAGRKTKAKSP